MRWNTVGWNTSGPYDAEQPHNVAKCPAMQWRVLCLPIVCGAVMADKLVATNDQTGNLPDIVEQHIQTMINASIPDAPDNGWPYSALTSAVQQSLDRADSALQPGDVSAADIADATAIGVSLLTAGGAAGVRALLDVVQAVGDTAKLWSGTQSAYDALPAGTKNAAGFIAVIK